MSAADHLSEHIKEFIPHAKGMGWDTCEGSTGECEQAAFIFSGQARNKQRNDPTTGKEKTSGYAPSARMEAFSGPLFDISNRSKHWQSYPPDAMIEHVVPVVNDHVVDFTLRQFDPSAAFPHVEHRDGYAKRFKHHNPDYDYYRDEEE